MYSLEAILKAVKDHNYELRVVDDYPNLIGVRFNNVPDKFDDELYVITYKNSGQSVSLLEFPITTDPGKHYLTHPCNKKGTGIVVPGWYKHLWSIGIHNGKYKALVQTGPIKVYRDNDKDGTIDIDPSTIDAGYFGINFHKAGKDSENVDWNSAGCQVTKREADFYTVFNRAVLSKAKDFDYILFNHEDIK